MSRLFKWYDPDDKRMYLRVAFFPFYIVWLEVILHIYMGKGLSYFPLYLFFSLAVGCLFTFITLFFSSKVARRISKVLALVLPFFYMVESIARNILQSYYMASALKTAANNRLTDYGDVVMSQFFRQLPVSILMFLPGILLVILGKKVFDFYKPLKRRSYVAAAVVMVAFHIIGLIIMQLPWSGDIRASKLYTLDTNIEERVGEFGLISTLRLDIKYMIVKPGSLLDDNFGDLGFLEGDEQETEAEVEYGYNVMDVDLETLSQSSNEDIAWLANYFSSVQPTQQNEYTGMFQGYNVIEIVMEGFSGYGIDQELTPTLYRLTHEGFVFDNYYTALHFTSTSGGECQVNTGLYPKNGMPVTMTRTGELGTNLYFSLAQQLGREGYDVMGFHDNYDMYGREVSHTNMGLLWRYSLHGLDAEVKESDPESLQWPQYDAYMIDHSTDMFLADESTNPFFVYYLTVSGHVTGATGYAWNRVSNQYRDIIEANSRFAGMSSGTQAYEACALVEVDKAVEHLISALEAAGQLDNTLIVLTPDHIPYSAVDTIEELAGATFGDNLDNLDESNLNFDVYRNTLVIWNNSMTEAVHVSKPCCQVDILPTVSNLLGLTYDSRMMAGSDILSNSEGLVIFTSRCWRTDRGFYNRFTGTFTPAEGVNMTEEQQQQYVEAMNSVVNCKLNMTALIVENNFYEQVFPGSRTN